MAPCKCYSLSSVRYVEDGLEHSQIYDEVNKTSSSKVLLVKVFNGCENLVCLVKGLL